MTTFKMEKFQGNTFKSTLDYKHDAMNIFERVHGSPYVVMLADEAKVATAKPQLSQRFGI